MTDRNDKDSSKARNTNGSTILYFQPSAKVIRFAKKYRTEIAASSSSVFSTFIAFPLDFAKSRMQSYDTTFTATIKDAYKAEGLRGIWRGSLPPLVSVTVVRTISFSLYQRAKYTIDRAMNKHLGKSPLAMANAPNGYPNVYTLACFGLAGACSGIVITTISCPFELTKLNEQLAGKILRDARSARDAAIRDGSKTVPPPYDKKFGSWATARRLMKQRGIAGLYSGYRLHLLRDTIGTGIYFMSYESVKQLLANARGNEPTSPHAVLIAGGLCGIISWACIYPIDVAKTMYQKALLASDNGRAPRPPIRFFGVSSYRGQSILASGSTDY